VVCGDGLRLLLSVVLRLQGRPHDHAGLLERDGQARQGPQSLPRGLPAVRRRRRKPPAGARPLQRAGRIFLWPLPACRCALRAAAGLHDRSDATRRHRRDDDQGRQPRQPGDQSQPQGHQHEGHRRRRLCPDRLAGRSGRADPPRRNQPERRPPHAAAAVRQHEQGHHQVQHADVRRARDAQSEGPVRRVGRQVVAQAVGQGSARRRPGLRPQLAAAE